jgi:hypothetical protein
MEVGDLLGVDDLLEVAGSSLRSLKSEIAHLKEATVRHRIAMCCFQRRPAAAGACCSTQSAQRAAAAAGARYCRACARMRAPAAAALSPSPFSHMRRAPVVPKTEVAPQPVTVPELMGGTAVPDVSEPPGDKVGILCAAAAAMQACERRLLQRARPRSAASARLLSYKAITHR